MSDALTQTLADLAAAAGSQGPLAGPGQAEGHRRRLLAGDPADAAERLLQAASGTPEPPGDAPVTVPQLRQEAAELLATLGEVPAVRDRLVRALDDPPSRLLAVQALALLADPATGDALAALAGRQLGTPTLTDDELVYLASALGSVGGAAAVAAVEALRARPWPAEVARELDIARQALEG